MSDQRHALVVDDDAAVRRLTIKALAGYHFVCDEACDGEQAHKLLAFRKYDAVVTDLKMPKRHGHALAVELLALGDNRPVVVVLTGVLEPRLAADLIARGVDDITFKPADLPLFAAKVHALCQRRAAHRTALPAPGSIETDAGLTPIALEQVEERLDALAGSLPISHSAIEVVNLIQAGNPNVDEIARSIARDPALSLEVLRVANSSHFNPGGKRIDDLSQAIVRVGDRQISELALAKSTMQSLCGAGMEWIHAEATWRRCLATSLIVRQLHPAADLGADDEGLFLSALLLPLSRVLLGQAFPEHYKQMIGACQATGCSLASCERRLLPLSPARAMAGMLARWNLSPRLFRPMQHAGKTYPELATLTEPLRSKVERLRFAEFLAQMTTGHFEPWDEIEFPLPETLARLRVDDLATIVDIARGDLPKLAGPHPPAPPTIEVRYFKLGAESHDVLAILLVAIGVKIVRITRHDACEPLPAIINCLDTSEERLIWFLDDAVPDSRRALLCSAPLPAHSDSWGPVIVFPNSFRTLSAAIAIVAHGSGASPLSST